MIKYLTIAKGHYFCAIENKDRIMPWHTPTMWHAWRQTLSDLFTLNRYQIYDPKSGAFIVYEVIRKPLYNMEVVQIHSVYCPKLWRGIGRIAHLRTEIFRKHKVGTIIGDYKAKDSNEVGRLYANYALIP